MYQEFILERIENDIHRIPGRSYESIENQLVNAFDDVDAIAKTFNECLPPKLFQKMLSFPHSKIQKICDSFLHDYAKLVDNKNLLEMYKHFALEGLNCEKKRFDDVKVVKEIENHCKNIF
jgi:hypothetical protein